MATGLSDGACLNLDRFCRWCFALHPLVMQSLDISVYLPQDAAEWLKYTYLNVRMLRNPTLYGVPLGQIDTDRELKVQIGCCCCHYALEMPQDSP